MENLKDSDLWKAFTAYGHQAISPSTDLSTTYILFTYPSTGWKTSLTFQKIDWENLGGEFLIIF